MNRENMRTYKQRMMNCRI